MRAEGQPVSATPVELFSAEALRDPYPLYRRLREEDPAHWSARANAWLVSRYDDVAALLRDKRCSSKRARAMVNRLPEAERGRFKPLTDALELWMLLMDPPDHTRLRALVGKAFTPALVERLRGRVAAVVAELLAGVAREARFDVIAALAHPLPVIVICELLGVPTAERERMKSWSDDIAAFIASVPPSPAQSDRAQASIGAMTAYFRGLIADKRRAPAQDLLSGLASAEEHGDVLSEDELLAMCSMLLFAGHETTTNLIGNGVLTLLRQPEQLAAVRRERALIAGAVEEILRFESPVQYVSRVALEDIELHGRRIRAGDPILLLLGSANRDGARFADPDRFDVRRADAKNLGFGHGAHFCIGAALSRLEGQLALDALLTAFPRLALAAGAPAWRPMAGFRALAALELELVR